MLTTTEIGIVVGVVLVFLALVSLICFLLCWFCVRRKRKPPGDNADDHTLHFFDFAHQRRRIVLGAMGVTDGPSLRQAIAALCALPDASSLALLYTNEADRCIEVDLDQLVAPDAALPQRMRMTAAYPLALAPHKLTAAPHTPNNAQSNPSNNVQSHPLNNVQSRPPINVQSNPSFNVQSQPSNNVQWAGHGESAVPPPIILPRRAHISAATPVHIVAARYAAGRGAALTTEDTAALEEAMLFGGARQAIRLPSGKDIRVDANAATAWLADGRLLHKCVAEELHYSVDNMSSAQWYAYSKPIYLPPGRWCVRAEASTADHRIVETSSRVFTVDLVDQC